jgi:exonuclease III
LNVHIPIEGKSDDTKDSIYKELEQVFNQFKKYNMNILLGDLNSKVGRIDISKPKPATGNESLHETSNDNRVRAVHSAT